MTMKMPPGEYLLDIADRCRIGVCAWIMARRQDSGTIGGGKNRGRSRALLGGSD